MKKIVHVHRINRVADGDLVLAAEDVEDAAAVAEHRRVDLRARRLPGDRAAFPDEPGYLAGRLGRALPVEPCWQR